MNKNFSCRTCENLCTSEYDKMGEKALLYWCECNSEFVDPDRYFCANHTDRETVKLVASHAKLFYVVKGFLQWWDSATTVNGGHIDRIRNAIAKAERSEDEPITDDEGDQ